MKTLILALGLMASVASADELYGTVKLSTYCSGNFGGKAEMTINAEATYDIQNNYLTVGNIAGVTYSTIDTWRISPRKIGFYAANQEGSIHGVFRVDQFGYIRRLRATQFRTNAINPITRFKSCVQGQVLRLHAWDGRQ